MQFTRGHLPQSVSGVVKPWALARRMTAAGGRIRGLDTFNGNQHVVLHAAPLLLHQIIWAIKVRTKSCGLAGKLVQAHAAIPLSDCAVVLLVAHTNSVAVRKTDHRGHCIDGPA